MQISYRPLAKQALALGAVIASLFAVLAVMPASSEHLAPGTADAAVVRAYKNGPVLFLQRAESKVVANYGGPVLAGAIGGRFGGPWGGAVGAVLGVYASNWGMTQVAQGRCFAVKAPWWNFRAAYPFVYRGWPCY